MIVPCVIILSLKDVLVSREELGELIDTQKETHIPTIIPIAFALLTPFCFCSSGSLAKHLGQPRLGFDSTILSFTS